MVMPSTVAHVRKSLTKTLGVLLDSETVMVELLKEFEPEVAKDFITTYVNQYDEQGNRIKDGKQIKLTTSVPQEQTDLDNLFLIDMGAGHEDQDLQSLGNVIGQYDYDGLATAKTEKLVLNYDTDKEEAIVNATNDIGELVDILELELIRDQIKVAGKQITIDIPYEEAYALGLIGAPLEITVKYMPATGSDFFGVVKGYEVSETVRIVMMSRNLDTLRAMDILLKASLILMRGFDKENETYKLASAEYFDTAPVSDNELPGLPSRIFGRQVEITYKVTYGMDSKVTKILKSFDLHL